MTNQKINLDLLLFVYNADAGIFSLVSDFAHKILSPETYACNLCKLTYGNFAMKKEWKDFIEGLSFKKIFLHKDEFYKKYPDNQDQRLPAILCIQDGQLRELIGSQDLNNQRDLISLKNLLEQRLAQ